MGKTHSTIQKAIEKARRSQFSEGDAKEKGGAAPADQNQERGSARRPKEPAAQMFQIAQAANVDRDIMEESRLVSEVDDRSALAAIKICRTRVLQRMRSNNWHTMLVTSTGAGEGKTLTAVNLAMSIAWDVNQSVMLVDLDLQRSKVAKYFGMEVDVENGIGEYLNGSAELPDIIYSLRGFERISVIPSFGSVDNSSDLLAGPRMKELLSWIRNRSDQTIVIFDMPPVLVDDDVLAFCPEVDAVLLVVAQGKTDRTALQKATELLAQTNLLGVVLNRCDDKSKEYAYGYY